MTNHLLVTCACLAAVAATLLPSSSPAATSCDEPGCEGAVRQTRSRLRVALAPQVGVTTFGALDIGAAAPALAVGADVQLLWLRGSGSWGMGLRLCAMGGVNMRKTEDRSRDASQLTFDAGFLLTVRWLWISPGLSISHISGEGLEERSSGVFPMLSLAAGLDIPLGERLALRLSASGGTLILAFHGSLQGGLVVRF